MGGEDQTFRADFSSEGVSRLRGVVEEKLKEFMGDYTDDTLVEYVIVLLKNGRSKDEAKNELDVFLGDDSDSFISWLWDHLGSNLSSYVQAQELQPGVPKAEPSAGDQPGKTGSDKIESVADKGNYVETYGHHKNRENKGHVKGDNDEAPLPRKSVAKNVNIRDEDQPSDSQSKPRRFLQSTIHKKRRRNDEEQHQRKREVSHSTVSAPKRLLQFAVRDAVATSRPPNATAEPSLKRLRSVISTTESYAEARPQRIRHASMSVAIKAMAEAVKDVTKVRPSRNVFDRLGNAMNGPNTSSHREYGGVAEDAVDGDFNVEMESLHSYYPRDDISMLHEGNMSSFQEVLDIDRGYGRENYDERGREGTDIYPSGSSSGKWVESSLKFQYGAADHDDGTAYRSRKDIIQPAAVHSAILTNSSSVSMKMRRPQYQEEIEATEMDDHERMRGADTNSEVWLMKTNNNHTVPFNGNAKPDATVLESERSQEPSGLRNTGPPAEDADSRTIFVSNVHFAATKDSLSKHFNKFGEVLKVIILTDPATGQPKGSAYIEFMSKEAAELALSLDGTSFLSRILKIVKKTSAQPDVASAMTWPRVARASPFVVPRYGRASFARGMQYRGGRVPMMLGARSFQWKRGSDSTVTETLGQASNSMILSPTTRSLTYVRADAKTNVSSG
ncbi:uncharacterized protein LOC125201216 isoform X1 [Salvia hispanica]|uniref:uncharacterized protein LOC125201216 isoform X1 n=2 Tax=Salvia hispanica TaxID=49212 RepID=UPI002009A520|nr:uncharacterized protein LOC125201216 isoform X1 [Salvia hispanica]